MSPPKDEEEAALQKEFKELCALRLADTIEKKGISCPRCLAWGEEQDLCCSAGDTDIDGHVFCPHCLLELDLHSLFCLPWGGDLKESVELLRKSVPLPFDKYRKVKP